MSNDTIAAIATAPGDAGIGIVRISGKKSLNILEQIFKAKEKVNINDIEPRKLYYGYIINPETNKILDEVLISYMKSPRSYTTEDVVEINCHGGSIPVKRILELVLNHGARIAEKGEFTKRAFLNGRLDLSQAEAVMDLISAKNNASYDMSLNQLQGTLSIEVNQLRDILINMLAHITVSIDFSVDDDIDEISNDKLISDGEEVLSRIEKLIESSDTGKVLREGLKTIILGKPNVGKSSLMNAILRENRAIVTEIPGTTRDVIEEFVNIKGIPLKIVDTAGIRETEDIVEKIGVERAKERLYGADLIIAVFDLSRELSQEDMEIIDLIKDKKSIILLNKTDLPKKMDINKIEEYIPHNHIINTSILKGEGIEILEDTLNDMFFKGEVKITDNIIVSNVRHKDQLLKARTNILDGLESIKISMPLDCVEVDIKECWSNLGEINGDTVSEDIINKIFEDFCIGK